MLYFDRNDVSDGVDVNKTIALKKMRHFFLLVFLKL